ncbi:MAG: hypothetical protein U0166_04635 [Acidobacteriota bacterium]
MGFFTASPYPPVAIEINASVARLCVAGASKSGPTWESYARRAIPQGVVRPGPVEPNVLDAEKLRDVVKALVEEGRPKGKNAALLLPDCVARSTILEFDALPSSPRDLAELVRFRMKKVTPFPIEQARVSTTRLAPLAGQQRLLAVAASEKVLAGYESALAPLSLHFGLVDLSTLNLLPLVAALRKTAPASESYMVVNADESCFSIAIVRQNDLSFFRTKIHPAADADGALTDENLAKEVRLSRLYFAERISADPLPTLYLREARGPNPRLAAELAAEGCAVTRIDPFAVAPAAEGLDADHAAAVEAAPLLGMIVSRRAA